MPRAGYEKLHALLTGEPIRSLYEIAEEERQRAAADWQNAHDREDKRGMGAAATRAKQWAEISLRGVR